VTSDDTGDDNLAPSIFFSDYQQPPAGSTIIPHLPRSEGGLIQSVKTAMLAALRETLRGTSLFIQNGRELYIDLDYPLVPEQYPGMWVQFSPTKLNRAGLGHEVPVQDTTTGGWSFIQEWTFTGSVTITIAALDSRTRDRLSDALIMMLAFARTPQLVITKPQEDTKAYRSLLETLDENPYVAMTINTDVITPGGQSASMGTPWQNDALTYEDTYSFDMVGQFNISFANDGLYLLSRIDPRVQVMEQGQPYEPQFWTDTPNNGPYGSGPGPGGSQNPTNVDFPFGGL
jgi:hypothetical protein